MGRRTNLVLTGTISTYSVEIHVKFKISKFIDVFVQLKSDSNQQITTGDKETYKYI